MKKTRFIIAESKVAQQIRNANNPIPTARLWFSILLMFAITRLVYWLIAQYYGLGFIDAQCHWDCGWYSRTAIDGYMTEATSGVLGNESNWVFFPLYPLLIGVISKITQINVQVVGVVFSNLCICSAAYFGVRYLEKTRKQTNPVFFILFCFIGPYSFYFSSVYTEALFFLLFTASLYHWEKEHHLLAGFLAALLSATRAIGVFWIVGVFISLMMRYRLRLVSVVMEKPVFLVVAVLAPLGLFLFMFYLYLHVGDALAFKHGQIAWGREFKLPWRVLYRGFKANDLELIATLYPKVRSQTYLAIWASIGLLLLLLPLFRRYWIEFSVGLIAILIPLSTGLGSFPRFIIGMPIFVFAIHDILAVNRYWPVSLGLLSVFNIWLLINWYQNAPFLT